jgi:hypothetical protein
VIAGQTTVMAVAPFDENNTGGGDAQFDAIVNFWLTDSPGNPDYYEQELRTDYRRIARQLCDHFAGGGNGLSAMEIGEQNGLNISHFSAVQTGAVYAYCPEYIQKTGEGFG